MNADRSIIDNLEPFVWNNDESVGYEVTIEMINEVVGLYSALDESQQAAATPDPALIERWASERREWCRRREALDPTDHAEIERVQQECRELIERLRHT